MRLVDLYFMYHIGENRFGNFAYEFNLLPDKRSKEEVIELAKSSLKDLENVLDDIYMGERFSKKRAGEITSCTVAFGYDYSNSSKNDSLRDGLCDSTLRYVISLDSSGHPDGLKLKLANLDLNSPRILRIYESILGIPGLEISDKAQLQVNRINSLRSEAFQVNKYLGMSQVD